MTDLKCDLGESPSWDGVANKLLSVDAYKNKIFIYDGINTAILQLKERIGAVMPSNQPDVLVAALERDIVSIDYSDPDNFTSVTLTSAPSDHGLPQDGFRFNDAKAGLRGHLVAGRMFDSSGSQPGRMYVLRKGEKLRQILASDVIHVPNGMAWDESRRVMYLADTGANTVYRYQVDDDGVPMEGRRSVAFKVPQDDEHGLPDGITIDADGNLWVAMVDSGRVACFSSSGEELHTVQLPVKRPTAVTFGGKDLETLFITTRAEKGSNSSPNAGGLFSTHIHGVKGAGAAYPYQL